MIKNASSVLGYVEVGEAVAIVVADGGAHSVAASRNACLIGDLGKSSVTVIVIKSVFQRRVGFVEIAASAIDEVNVHPPIVVVIKKCAARSGSFRQVIIGGASVDVSPGDPAVRRWDCFE